MPRQKKREPQKPKPKKRLSKKARHRAELAKQDIEARQAQRTVAWGRFTASALTRLGGRGFLYIG